MTDDIKKSEDLNKYAEEWEYTQTVYLGSSENTSSSKEHHARQAPFLLLKYYVLSGLKNAFMLLMLMAPGFTSIITSSTHNGWLGVSSAIGIFVFGTTLATAIVLLIGLIGGKLLSDGTGNDSLAVGCRIGAMVGYAVSFVMCAWAGPFFGNW